MSLRDEVGETCARACWPSRWRSGSIPHCGTPYGRTKATQERYSLSKALRIKNEERQPRERTTCGPFITWLQAHPGRAIAPTTCSETSSGPRYSVLCRRTARSRDLLNLSSGCTRVLFSLRIPGHQASTTKQHRLACGLTAFTCSRSLRHNSKRGLRNKILWRGQIRCLDPKPV